MRIDDINKVMTEGIAYLSLLTKMNEPPIWGHFDGMRTRMRTRRA